MQLDAWHREILKALKEDMNGKGTVLNLLSQVRDNADSNKSRKSTINDTNFYRKLQDLEDEDLIDRDRDYVKIVA